MTEIQKQLFELRDEKYAAFEAKLAPTIPVQKCIGVRVPQLRSVAAKLIRDKKEDLVFGSLPHEYYDENLLHSILISKNKNYETCIKELERFLPYVDNWAACDTLRPQVFSKHKEELFPKVKEWMSSRHTYTCRFGIDMLMTYYLDEDFKPFYLELPAKIKSDEYYVNMMIAWYYATALAKQWDSTVAYIENKVLPPWVHNKTIQKACESFRITDNQKSYLKQFKN